MRKWNWSLFVVIVLLCCIGALQNKTITNFKDGAILVLIFGLPIGLGMAWMTKDNS